MFIGFPENGSESGNENKNNPLGLFFSFIGSGVG